MAKKGGETGSGGGDGGDDDDGSVKGDVAKIRGGISVRLSASPPQLRSPGRRSSRRPWRASPSRGSPSSPRSTRQRPPVSRRRVRASPPRPTICASPPRRSLSPRRCATAPQRRVSSPRRISPPRSHGRNATLGNQRATQKDFAGNSSGEMLALSRPLTRVPRRLVFDGTLCDMSKDAAVPTNDDERKSNCARNNMLPSCEILNSSTNGQEVQGMLSRPTSRVPRQLDTGGKVCDMSKEPAESRNTMNLPQKTSNSITVSGHKRPWPTNSSVDSIWKNAQTSSGRTLGTLSVDLVSETIVPKKCVSTTPCNLVNSKRDDDESRSTEQPEPRNKEIAACSSTCCCHKIFICPHELSTSQRLGDRPISMTQRKVIPGGNEEADFMVKKSCHLLDGMIKVVTVSHKIDICFNGNLLLENFRVTEEGDVKLSGAEPGVFSKAGSKLDNAKVADIIQHDLFAGRSIPPSITELLNLLRTGELKDEDAMSNSISLMPELERMSLFEWMLKTLEKLEHTDPPAYTIITNILKAHICWHNWHSKAELNQHLVKILNHADPVTGNITVYPKTYKGLLRFARNSIEHLHKHSYDLITRESLFYLFEIDHIVSGTFQGLFEVLQGAMSLAGKWPL